jgi:hypothetical protein
LLQAVRIRASVRVVRSGVARVMERFSSEDWDSGSNGQA